MSDNNKKKKVESVSKALNAFMGSEEEEENTSARARRIRRLSKAQEEGKDSDEVEEKDEIYELEMKGTSQLNEDVLEESLDSDSNEDNEEKNTIKIKTPKFSESLEKLKENLKPELKEILTKETSSIPKHKVEKLLNDMKSSNKLFENKEISKAFENVSSKDSAALSKKFAEWEVPKEASEINANVILAWLNKTKNDT